MHFLALAITALAVACTLISAFPINGPCILSFLSFDLPFPSINHHDHRKYFNNTLQWIGPDSNGVNITLYGKANEVLSQLSTIDASYIENTTLTPDAHHTSRSTISPAYDKYNIKCCPVAGENFSPQNITSVRTATNDVVRLAKKFRMVTAPPPPPSEGEEKTKAGCYTVTASSGAAVVICYNDGAKSYADISMDNVAEQANAIVNTCPVNPKGKVCGQLFADGDGWNVIIDKDSGLQNLV